jgi:hypothetical protein
MKEKQKKECQRRTTGCFDGKHHGQGVSRRNKKSVIFSAIQNQADHGLAAWLKW